MGGIGVVRIFNWDNNFKKELRFVFDFVGYLCGCLVLGILLVFIFLICFVDCVC